MAIGRGREVTSGYVSYSGDKGHVLNYVICRVGRDILAGQTVVFHAEVIADAAHSLGAAYHGKPSGSVADAP